LKKKRIDPFAQRCRFPEDARGISPVAVSKSGLRVTSVNPSLKPRKGRCRAPGSGSRPWNSPSLQKKSKNLPAGSNPSKNGSIDRDIVTAPNKFNGGRHEIRT
jgi:hypothetical protein